MRGVKVAAQQAEASPNPNPNSSPALALAMAPNLVLALALALTLFIDLSNRRMRGRPRSYSSGSTCTCLSLHPPHFPPPPLLLPQPLSHTLRPSPHLNPHPRADPPTLALTRQHMQGVPVQEAALGQFRQYAQQGGAGLAPVLTSTPPPGASILAYGIHRVPASCVPHVPEAQGAQCLPAPPGGGRGEGGEGVLSVRRNPTSLGRPEPHRVLCGTTGTDMTDMKPRVSAGAAERAAHDKAAAMLQAGSPSPSP